MQKDIESRIREVKDMEKMKFDINLIIKLVKEHITAGTQQEIISMDGRAGYLRNEDALSSLEHNKQLGVTHLNCS
jgi:hypothetical protein